MGTLPKFTVHIDPHVKIAADLLNIRPVIASIVEDIAIDECKKRRNELSNLFGEIMDKLR